MQLSDGDTEQQRASKKNALAYAADILGCRSIRAMTVVIVDVSLPLEVEAGKTCRYMKSPDGVFSWYLKMATACGLHVVHECVDAAYSEFLAQRMGLCDEALECMPLSEATIQTMAHALGDFLRLIIFEELLFQRTYFDRIPGKFVAHVSNDEQRQQALEFSQRSFEALEELEELVYADRHARELQNTLLWPLATWPREVLLALCESDFDGVLGSADAGMYKELTECFRGWWSSWSIELMFNEARRVSSENLGRRLSNLALWHRAANSLVVEDFGSGPLVVQPEDEAETCGALPEKVFNSQKVDFSACEKFFERCLSDKPSWPSPKPEDTMAIPLAQGALSFFAGEYDKLQTLFLSRVVQPDTVLIGHDWLPGGPVGWVLSTWRWGVQVLLGHVKKSDGNGGTLEISEGDTCFEQWCVHDLTNGRRCPRSTPSRRCMVLEI